MVVGVVLDDRGIPICSEMWPGNTADVKTLLPVAERLRDKFGVRNLCVVADRGMMSRKTVDEIEARGWSYILGMRMRRVREVSVDVLGRGGRYEEVSPKSANQRAPSPLKVKEVRVADRRYIVCLNEDQAEKDRRDRSGIVQSLTDALKRGDKTLIGNRGYRRYVRADGRRFTIDAGKVKSEARYDGKWVLTTNTDLNPREVALKYKQLWTVEEMFRSMKALLQTRPIYHSSDEAIRGHVFCTFLALMLRKELKAGIESRGWHIEWADIIRDLDNMIELEITLDGKAYTIRSETKGTVGKVAQACGVALPPAIRQC